MENIVLHIFLGIAENTRKTSYTYPTEKNYAFMLYYKTKTNKEYDTEKAKQIVENLGFVNIEFIKAGTLNKIPKNKEFEKYYLTAIEEGFCFVLYSDPIEENETM